MVREEKRVGHTRQMRARERRQVARETLRVLRDEMVRETRQMVTGEDR